MSDELEHLFNDISKCQEATCADYLSNIIIGREKCSRRRDNNDNGLHDWGLPWYDNFREDNTHNILLLAQDFGSEDYVNKVRRNEYEQDYYLNNQYPESSDPSFNQLKAWLCNKGVDLWSQCFLWNVLLCSRKGTKDSGPIVTEKRSSITDGVLYEKCASKWLKEIINAVNPKIIGAVGSAAFYELAHLYKNSSGFEPYDTKNTTYTENALISPIRKLNDTYYYLPLPHPSSRNRKHLNTFCENKGIDTDQAIIDRFIELKTSLKKTKN